MSSTVCSYVCNHILFIRFTRMSLPPIQLYEIVHVLDLHFQQSVLSLKDLDQVDRIAE